ncbi:MAG: OmpA family protein, partial [Proteobacteria bacterium]
MKCSHLITTSLLALSLGFGCASPGKRTATGAGAGALGGAGVGGLIGGGKGAIIGAGAGAILGGVIGNRLDKQAGELAEVAETKRTADGIL